MNATKQGLQAGQSTRRIANKATSTAVEGGKTVATAVSGFVKGFFSNPDAPAPRARRKIVAVQSVAKRNAKAK
ncbi:MAG: hypothetical protein QFB87_05080 [Patescibacteria group bacterium]|nr:hypothetical protein [Patescibacteria group bacterium]